MRQTKKSNLLSALGLIVIASAWHCPGTALCAIISWIGCILLCHGLPRASNPYKSMYLAGVALNAIGFYWLFFTIRDFGGFHNFFAVSIFAFYLLASALQFVVFVFVWKNLPLFFHRHSLALATAWMAAETLSIRIFPWFLGHSQLAYIKLAQTADLAGVLPISFIMLWLSDSLITAFRTRRLPAGQALAVLLFFSLNLYGNKREQQFLTAEYPLQNVALIQANISLEEKHNLLLPIVNLQRYIELTKEVQEKGSLIIWPESVITDFISSKLTHVSEEPLGRLPFYQGSSLILGSLTYQSELIYHNSAIAVAPDGAIAGIYHKQILMPFGEFTPFSNILPWLKDINATAGEFTAGNEITVFSLPYSGEQSLYVSPLICYEDVVPELSWAAAKKGAQVLVNLTNDAWFGNTIAPYQHHLIAAFRAIENRRYLLRSTNTGLTAIVNPIGQTISQLEPYSEGVLKEDIRLIDFSPPSHNFNYSKFFKIISSIVLILALLNWRRRRRAGKK